MNDINHMYEPKNISEYEKQNGEYVRSIGYPDEWFWASWDGSTTIVDASTEPHKVSVSYEKPPRNYILNVFGKMMVGPPDYPTLDGLPVDVYNALTPSQREIYYREWGQPMQTASEVTYATYSNAVVRKADRDNFINKFYCGRCREYLDKNVCKCGNDLTVPVLVEKSL